MRFALSLQKERGVDLFKGHLVWLRYVLDALYALSKCKYSMITYDQLLSDPITSLSPFFDPAGTFTPHLLSSLINSVQLYLKHHHVSDFRANESQHFFEPFAEIYSDLRESSPRKDELQNDYDHSKFFGAGNNNFRANGIIDSLLHAIGQYEQEKFTISALACRRTPQTRYYQFTQVSFPSSRKDGKIIETIPIKEDEWQRVAITISEPELLMKDPIYIKPLISSGTVKIFKIQLTDKATGEIVWAVQFPQEFDN